MTEMEHSTPGDTTQHSSRRGGNIRIKLIYIIVLALILVICATQALLQLTNSISATIRINSLYSADGKNPDGSPFSIMDLMCDDVMECAAQKLDGKLTAEEIRSHLTISDTMSGNSFTRLEESIYNSENENTYFPTEYLITYSTITQQTREEGFLAQCKCLLDSFSQPSHTEILNAVLRSYREYYGQMYLNHDALFEIDWEEVDSMDYYNRFEFLDDTVERLRRFLQYRNDRTLSQFNGSYTDLIAELTQGPAQDIESFQAYVTQNGITNNKDVLLRQFVYMQNLYEEEHTRKMQEYQVLREAIEMYDSTTTKVVFVPALDDEKAFYMNRTKVGLDYLSEKADEAKLKADSADYTAKHYLYLQSCFDIADENSDPAQEKNTPPQRDHADKLYARLKDEIQRLTAQAQLLATDANQSVQDDLVVSAPFANVGLTGAAMSAAKSFALLLMAAYVTGYFIKGVFAKKARKGMGEEL